MKITVRFFVEQEYSKTKKAFTTLYNDTNLVPMVGMELVIDGLSAQTLRIERVVMNIKDNEYFLLLADYQPSDSYYESQLLSNGWY